jgi:Ca2+-binding EF-hand superfamily protein
MCAKILERLREKTLQRGAVGIHGIGRLFRIADDNSDKAIDLKNELPKLIHDIGLQINKAEMDELILHFDKNHNGFVDYEEFLGALAPPINEKRILWVNKAFDKLDADKSGVVTVKDIELVHNPKTSALIRVGKTSADQIFANMLRSYDTDAGGTITKEEFFDYYRQISASIDNDDYFITMIKGAWNLHE